MTVKVDNDIKTENSYKLSKPKKYNVILINDDKTTFDFVIYILMSMFNKDRNEAEVITKNIHINGKGICGTYTKEIAETKQMDVIQSARFYKFPLECRVEPAD